MQKRLSKVLLIFGILICTTAMANNGGLKLEKVAKKEKTVQLSGFNHDGVLSISIKDTQGYELFSEQYANAQIRKQYDMSQLPFGTYFIEIEGETKLFKYQISSRKNGFDLLLDRSIVLFKPVIRKAGKDVFISMLSLENTFLKLRFYDENDRLIYNERLEGSFNLGKKLNLSQLKAGNYRLIMESERKTFMEHIIIE